MASPEEIRAVLERAAHTVTVRPTVGQRVYANTAVVESGLSCRVQEKNHSLTVDLPSSMGGEDSGPSPSVLLRAALSSCVAMGIKMWAVRTGVTIDRIEVRVETDVDARGQFGVSETIAPGFESIRIRIQVDSAADRNVIWDTVQTSLRFSPLMDALRRGQVVETQVNIDRRVLEDH